MNIYNKQFVSSYDGMPQDKLASLKKNPLISRITFRNGRTCVCVCVGGGV